MPKDNINRAIQRGAGAADGENYEFARYEGYGLAGAAVIVDCMTDNVPVQLPMCATRLNQAWW